MQRQKRREERIQEQKAYEEEEKKRALDQVKFTYGAEITLCDRLAK